MFDHDTLLRVNALVVHNNYVGCLQQSLLQRLLSCVHSILLLLVTLFMHEISAEHMTNTPSVMFCNLIDSARILATGHVEIWQDL